MLVRAVVLLQQVLSYLHKVVDTVQPEYNPGLVYDLFENSKQVDKLIVFTFVASPLAVHSKTATKTGKHTVSNCNRPPTVITLSIPLYYVRYRNDDKSIWCSNSAQIILSEGG